MMMEVREEGETTMKGLSVVNLSSHFWEEKMVGWMSDGAFS